MIDVFLRWYPQNPVRQKMAELVKARLEEIKGIHLHVVHSKNAGEPFHIHSKYYAEHFPGATSNIYCVMDDDQFPIANTFFRAGSLALEQHPEYGMVAGFPLEYCIAGQPYAERTETVIEAHSIGCPYFVRKGTLTHFPDSPIHMYDGDLSKVVTDQGLKTGFVRAALYNHLGYGFSQVEHAD